MILGFEETEREMIKQIDDVAGSKAAWEDISKALIENIRSLTQSGVDGDEVQFAPYAAKTIEIKKKKGQQIHPVNLTDTGKMLASISSKPKLKGTEIYLKGSRNDKIATAHALGTDKMPARDFFHFGETLANAIFEQEVFQKHGILFSFTREIRV